MVQFMTQFKKKKKKVFVQTCRNSYNALLSQFLDFSVWMMLTQMGPNRWSHGLNQYKFAKADT